jgi:hypothetical protein
MLKLLILSILWLPSPAADDPVLHRSIEFLTYHLQLAEEEDMPYLLVREKSLEFYIEGARLEEIPADAIERVSGPAVQLASVDRIELHFPNLHPPLAAAYPEIDFESTAGIFRIHMSDGSEIVLVSRRLQEALEGFIQRGKRVPLDGYLNPDFSASSLTFITMDDVDLHHFRRHLRPGMKVVY